MDTTITANQAAFASSAGNGGGVWHGAGALTGTRTIIARNTDASGAEEPDLHGDITPSFVLLGSATGSSGIATGPLVGSNGVPVDPRLGPLADNDGPTRTHAIGTDSPAFDAGGGGCAGDIDQRGYQRPQLDACDIGAYEHVDTTPPETSFGAQPADPSLTAEAEFTFTSTDTDGSGIAFHRCSLDGAEYAPCPEPLTYTVDEGSHTLEAYAVDDGGNSDPTPIELHVAHRPQPAERDDRQRPGRDLARGHRGDRLHRRSDGDGAGIESVSCCDRQRAVRRLHLARRVLQTSPRASHNIRDPGQSTTSSASPDRPLELNWTYDAAPTSEDDAGTTSEDTPLTVAGPGVLGNDSDDASATDLTTGPATAW